MGAWRHPLQEEAPLFYHLKRSIIAQMAILLGALIAVTLVSTGAAWLIAESTRGDARAINHAGSLRMQSWRLAATLSAEQAMRPMIGARTAAEPPEDADTLVAAHIAHFEHLLSSPHLTDAIPDDPEHPTREAYRRVLEAWRTDIVPALRGPAAFPDSGAMPYLEQVGPFVGRIDHLVQQLEEHSAGSVRQLNALQLSAMLATTLFAVLAILYLRYRVAIPLRDLQTAAHAIRGGNLRARVPEYHDDELGTVGRSLSEMTARLKALHDSMEEQVEAKTEALQRSNHALQILYEATRAVTPERFEHAELMAMLREVQRITDLGSITVRLEPQQPLAEGRNDDPAEASEPASGCRAWTTDPSGQPRFCTAPDYRGCPCRAGAASETPALGLIRFRIREDRHEYGVLLAEAGGRKPVDTWVIRLLDTVSAQIARSYGLMLQTRERQRLALMEERAIIARELHDSLAQSLSYLKIQSARLERVLAGSPADAPPERTRAIVQELRDGLKTAYRQLRDLLTTFRMQVQQPGLEDALRVTAEEFSNKGEIPVHLHLEPMPEHIAAHQEIHILQIVREALSNTLRHAHARTARIRIERGPLETLFLIEDDGQGIPRDSGGEGHYGLSIMKERAASLGGTLEIGNLPAGGTRVTLRVPTPEGTDA